MMRSTFENTDDVLPARLPKGFVLGGCYLVEGWLRDGGMAAIHRARRIVDERPVAIKLQLPLTGHDPATAERFEREVEMLRRAADCRSVVDLLDVGELDDGRRYLVMEWIEGENLEDLLDFLRNMDQRLTLARACRICRDVARGLAELHERGMAHLDLKPANVMVRPGADGADEIVLVDLGIAAELGAEWGGDTSDTVVLGTFAYVAPEQERGGPPDPSFDVHALGVLSFEAISGGSVPPRHWMSEALPRLETLRNGVPAALAELVHSCMDVAPRRRPQSAQQVASELAELIEALAAEEARSGPMSQEGLVRTGRTEIVARSTEPSHAVPVVTGATDVVLVHDDVASPVVGEGERRGGHAAADPMAEGSSVEGEVGTEREGPGEPPGRPWLRAVVLSAVASLVVAGVALSRSGGDPGLTESARAEADGTREDPAEPRRASTGEGAGALATGRSPSSLEAGAGAAAAKQASRPGARRRGASSTASCRSRRGAAERARSEARWQVVLRTTAADDCWTGPALRLQRKRLRVEAFAELGEYERCIDAGQGSRDDGILLGVSYCETKLGPG